MIDGMVEAQFQCAVQPLHQASAAQHGPAAPDRRRYRPPWQALCDDCFRQEIGLEPWDSLKMKPIRHGTRGRR